MVSIAPCYIFTTAPPQTLLCRLLYTSLVQRYRRWNDAYVSKATQRVVARRHTPMDAWNAIPASRFSTTWKNALFDAFVSLKNSSIYNPFRIWSVFPRKTNNCKWRRIDFARSHKSCLRRHIFLGWQRLPHNEQVGFVEGLERGRLGNNRV